MLYDVDDASAADPIWTLVPDGLPRVVLFVSPGCQACYGHIDSLERIRLATGDSARTLLVFSSSWPHRELGRAAARILAKHPFGGVVAVDPRREAALQIGDSPPASPFTCVVDERHRLLQMTRGRCPDVERTSVLLQAWSSGEPARVLGERAVRLDGPTQALAALQPVPDAGDTPPVATVMLVGFENTPASTAQILAEASSLPSGDWAACLVAPAGECQGKDAGGRVLEGLSAAYGIPLCSDATGRIRTLAASGSAFGPWIVAVAGDGARGRREASAFVHCPGTLQDTDESWALLDVWARSLGGAGRSGERGGEARSCCD